MRKTGAGTNCAAANVSILNMASMGKCSRCNKTVYQLEAVRYGPPGKEQVAHKGCFKCMQSLLYIPLDLVQRSVIDRPFLCFYLLCLSLTLEHISGENEGCNWQLTIGSYHYYEGKGTTDFFNFFLLKRIKLLHSWFTMP